MKSKEPNSLSDCEYWVSQFNSAMRLIAELDDQLTQFHRDYAEARFLLRVRENNPSDNERLEQADKRHQLFELSLQMRTQFAKEKSWTELVQ